jgi:hypothetical protein
MASSSRTRAAVIASGILIATPAGAQSSDTPTPPPAQPAAPQAPQDKPAPVQVRPMSMQPAAMASPGPARRAPRKGAVPRKRGQAAPIVAGTPVASAPAFFRLDGGSTRISVEVTTKVEVAESAAQGRLVYKLRGARVIDRVNLLPLLTGFFATPVDRAQLVQDDHDVTLIIDLREATTPTHRVVETPRGMVLQVDFPHTATGERPGEVQESSRERAKRRTKAQTIGSDKGDGGGSGDEN